MSLFLVRTQNKSTSYLTCTSCLDIKKVHRNFHVPYKYAYLEKVYKNFLYFMATRKKKYTEISMYHVTTYGERCMTIPMYL